MAMRLSANSDRPQLWVVGGPNGAGKSTLVRVHHKLAARLQVINPDDIAFAIDPARRNETAVLLRAGKEALRMRRELLASRHSFLVETTLTGQSELALMQEARTAGLKVNLAFVGLTRVEMSASRVGERVLDGGHDVPLDDIVRRFGRSMANLRIALSYADRAYLLDNAGRRHRLIYATESGRIKYQAPILPTWASTALA